MMREVICIVCPVGCHLKVEEKDGEYIVSGNKCKRGADYGVKEVTAPTRVLPTTVKITGAALNRLPVKTDGAIPKEMIFEAMKIINQVEVASPVHVGDIIIENILDTGINIVATRDL